MLKRFIQMFGGLKTCRGAADFLLDYVEGRLSTKMAAKFEAHISMCPNCAMYLEQYRETVKMLDEIPAPDPPDELADLTREFIRTSLENQHK